MGKQFCFLARYRPTCAPIYTQGVAGVNQGAREDAWRPVPAG